MPKGIYQRSEETRKKQLENLTYRFPKGHKPVAGFKKGHTINPKGETNHLWKEEVGYNGIHKRIRTKLGTPNICEICGRSDLKHYEWSNKDHKYSENIEDWQRVCSSCHLKYDYKFNNRNRR